MEAAPEELTPAETAGAALRLTESSYTTGRGLKDSSLAQQSTIILNESLKRHVDGRNVTPQPPAKLLPGKPQKRKRGRETSSAKASNKRLKPMHDGAADHVGGAKLPRPTFMTQRSSRAMKQHGDEVFNPPDDSPVKIAQLAVSKDRQSVHPRDKAANSTNRGMASVNGGMKDQLMAASEKEGSNPPPDEAVRRGPGRPKANKISSTAEPKKTKPKEGLSTKHQLRSNSVILDSPDWSRKPGHGSIEPRKVQSTQANGTQQEEIAGPEGQDEYGGNTDMQEQRPSEVHSQGLGGKTRRSEARSDVESEDAVCNTAGNANAGDGDQNLDKNTEHNEDIDESLSANIELFGQRNTWKKIIKAVEKVRKFRTGTRPSSRTVRRFFSCIEECGKIYKALGAKDEIHEHLSQHETTHLNKLIDNLESEVHELQGTGAGPRKKVKLLLDGIYVYGVPDLVTLLGDAMAVRTGLYSANDDIKALEEILKLQVITITLCTAAKQWRMTPKIGGVSFVKEIERQIFPYLRDIRTAFENELDTRHNKLRQVRRVEARERRKLEVIEETRRSRQELVEMIEEKRRKTFADMLRNERDMEMLLGSRPKTWLSTSPVPKRKFAMADSWTKEQDRQLVHQLRILRYLPGKFFDSLSSRHIILIYCPVEQRYINLLNTPLLQNKLPEHIRQRTLYYKPYMEMAYTEVGKEVPDWISSLQ